MKKYLKAIIIANITVVSLMACGKSAPYSEVDESVISVSEEVITEDVATKVETNDTTEPTDLDPVDENDINNTNVGAKDFIVVIDPGHQRHQNSEKEASAPGSSVMKMKVTSGTSGVFTGKKEYELTLEISLLLKQALEDKGYTVYLTRETHDVDISNQERAKFATDMGADIFIRIHADSINDSSVRGACALVPTKNNQYIPQLADASNKLAKNILDSYCESTGIKNRGVKNGDDMTGINFSTVPVTILEMGFMSNSNEDQYMAQADSQELMVLGIVSGIEKYYEETAEQ